MHPEMAAFKRDSEHGEDSLLNSEEDKPDEYGRTMQSMANSQAPMSTWPCRLSYFDQQARKCGGADREESFEDRNHGVR